MCRQPRPAVALQDCGHVRRVARRRGRGVCRSAGQVLELLARDGHDRSGHLPYVGHAVRARVRGIALAVPRARQTGDPAGVVHGDVDVDVVRGHRLEGFETALQQPTVIRRQVDGVDQLRAVAAVDDDGGGPGHRGQALADLDGLVEREGLLRVGRADARRPHGVDVDQESAPGENVRIAGRGATVGLDEPIARPGQQVGVDGVQRVVRPAIRPQVRQCVGDRVDPAVFEVAGLRVLPGRAGVHRAEDTDLEDVPGGEQPAQERRDGAWVSHGDRLFGIGLASVREYAVQ